MDNKELEKLYGPLARYSDYRRGERIVFTEGDKLFTGTIIWVGLSDPEIPDGIYYVVQVDRLYTSPYVVFPSAIIELC
jgi:hypothetical protein